VRDTAFPVFPFYRDKKLNTFETPNPTTEHALQVVRDYIGNLEQMKAQGKGITFVGENGVGKTRLACNVMKAVARADYKYACVELSTYVKLHHESFRLAGRIGTEGYMEDVERAIEVDDQIRLIEEYAQFLLLDDLGREHESVSGWSNEKVFDMLRYRHNRLMPTIITTNQPLPALKERYTEGLASFLQEATIMVLIEGEDYRAAGSVRN